MKRLAAVSVLIAATASAQDVEWVRQWERTQRARPASIGSVGSIAPVNEPGTPLVVHGRVFRSDGVTPAPGVVIFAYHTDRTGVYNRGRSRDWRLRGWAKSDANGRFEFRTIRPGAYPGGGTPAHIHMTLDSPSLPRRWAKDIEFKNDLAVAVRNGVQHVNVNIRIEDEGRF